MGDPQRLVVVGDEVLYHHRLPAKGRRYLAYDHDGRLSSHAHVRLTSPQQTRDRAEPGQSHYYSLNDHAGRYPRE